MAKMDGDLSKAIPSPLPSNSTESPKGLTYTKAYIQVFLLCSSFSLASMPYFTLAGVQTSLFVEMGSVGLAVTWLSMIFTTVIVPVIFGTFGLKFSYVVSAVAFCTYPATNFYASWFTIIPGFLIMGLAAGPLFGGASTYLTLIADRLVLKYGDTAKKYHGIFHGLGMMSLYGGAMFGSGLLSALLYDDFNNPGLSNISTSNISFYGNQSHPVNSSNPGVCLKDVGIDSVSVLYYYLIGVCLFLNLLAAVLAIFLFNPRRTPFACSKVVHKMCDSVKQMLLMFKQARFLLPLLIVFYTGMDQGYYFGLFSLHFISQCLGLAAVGLCVLIFCFGFMVSSLTVGWISTYTSRKLITVAAAIVQAGMILFMLFWEREPSYVMVFLTSLGWGIVDGIWMTLPAIYLSITSKNKNKPTEPTNNDSADITHSPVSEDEIAQHTQDNMKKEECAAVENPIALQTQDDMREEESLVGDQITLRTQDDMREEESLVGDQIALRTQDDMNFKEEESLVGDQIALHTQDDKREEIVPGGQIAPHAQDNKREEGHPEGDQDNRKEEESVFGLFWAPYAIGQALNFCFISASISAHANLWVLLSLLIVGACLLLVAEVRYGEGYQCGLFHPRLLKQGCSIRTRLP